MARENLWLTARSGLQAGHGLGSVGVMTTQAVTGSTTLGKLVGDLEEMVGVAPKSWSRCITAGTPLAAIAVTSWNRTSLDRQR